MKDMAAWNRDVSNTHLTPLRVLNAIGAHLRFLAKELSNRKTPHSSSICPNARDSLVPVVYDTFEQRFYEKLTIWVYSPEIQGSTSAIA
jgi:hypothetical protein